MAWEVDQKDLGHAAITAASSTIEVSLSKAAAAKTWIFVSLCNYNGGVSPTKVEGGGLEWKAIGEAPRSGNLIVATYRAYAAEGLAEGTKLTGTFSGSTEFRKIAACSFKGAGSDSAEVGKAKEEATTGKAHATEPEAKASGDLILENAAINSGTSNTPSAGVTELQDFTSPSGEAVCMEYLIATGAGKTKVSGEWAASARHVSAGIALSVGTEEGGGKTVEGKAALTGAGSLSAKGERSTFGKAALTGEGTLKASGAKTTFAGATLSGTGSLSAKGVVVKFGAANLTGEGTLKASGIRTTFDSATLSGTGSLTAAGERTAIGKANLTGTGSMTVSGIATRFAKASLTGEGTLSASGLAQHEGEESAGPPQYFLGQAHIVEASEKAQIFMGLRKAVRKTFRTLTLKRRWR